MAKWFKVREKGKNNYSRIALSLRSMDNEEVYSPTKYNMLHIAFLGWYWFITIPQIIRPKVKWVDTSQYEWSKPNPDGSKGYHHAIQRQYGFHFLEDALHVYYGIQPGEWHSKDRKNSDHSKVFFYPWKSMNRYRYSFYKPDGTHHCSIVENRHRMDFDAIQLAQSLVPKIKFRFKDFDGEEIEATCYISEMAWERGSGLFRWLKYVTKPKIERCLDISFNKEVGYEKGSWKGGTMGHSIELLPGESAESAFRRYGSAYDRYKNHGIKNRKFSDIEVIS